MAGVLAQRFHAVWLAACALGLGLSVVLYRRGVALHREGRIDDARRCPVRNYGGSGARRQEISQDELNFLSRSAAEQFYSGFEFNPRLVCDEHGLCGAVELDFTMLLYLARSPLFAYKALTARSRILV